MLPAVHERPWAVGVHLAFAALVGLAWSAPLAAAIGAATGAYPRGDVELFDPGGVMFLEALRHLRLSMPAIGAAWLVLAVAALPLGMVVLGFCIALLGAPGDVRPTWALARAVRALPSLTLVGLVALAADGLLVALIMIGGGSIVRSSWPEAPARDIARWSLLACVFAVVCAVGVLHDLARVAAVTGPRSTYDALAAALQTARRRPGRVAWAYTWRALLGLGAAGGAAWLGIRIGKSAPGAILAMALVHQVGLAAMGWSRLAWLAQAARLVAAEVVRHVPSPPAADRRYAPQPHESAAETPVAPPASESRHEPLA